MIDYTNLYKALQDLELSRNALQKLENPDEGIIRIHQFATVKAFEICYEALFRTLRQYLTEVLGASNLSGTARKDLIRIANENILLPSSPEQWFLYVAMRNLTSHEHIIKEMRRVLGTIPDFIEDAIKLYETMSGKSWKQRQ